MVLPEQVEALIDFVEGRPELALGHCSRTNEGKVLAKRLWSQCANLLNSLSPNCPTKTVAEWRAFFYEYKSRVLRKIKHKKQEISATGGGPSKIISLTPLQERLYTILGRDIGEPLPGVRHEPPPLHNIPAAVEVQMDLPSNIEGSHLSSFSILENNPLTEDPGEVIVELSTSTPIRDSDGVRRRKRVRRDPITDCPESEALKSAQERLEQIEQRSAESTLELARSNIRLAEAIEQANQSFSQSTSRIVETIEGVGAQLVHAIDHLGQTLKRPYSEIDSDL